MSKVILFFTEVKAELSRVVWPTKEQTLKYTAAVVIFSAVLSAILGATDYGLTVILQKVINR